MNKRNPRGAGRKPCHPTLKKMPINMKLPKWMIDWLRAQDESQAVLVEDALKEKYGLVEPDT